MTLMIATWFVADGESEASSFDQVTGKSSTVEFQSIYWRCVAVFFATSKRHNPAAMHVLFTNTKLPTIDGLDFAAYFQEISILTITLPITFRLGKDVTEKWGNQFYILDIIKYLSVNPMADAYIVVDSDCVWTKSADVIEVAIHDKGCLLYTLGPETYDLAQKINGVSRQEMGQLAKQVFPQIPKFDEAFGINYNGGEFFAASHQECVYISRQINKLWMQRLLYESGASGFLEEAHFLSIIYKYRGYEPYTANFFVKRMWTGLTYTNVIPRDISLPIWHLPAEKTQGFRLIFRLIVRGQLPDNVIKLNYIISSTMGVPRKGFRKYLYVFFTKIIEKAFRLRL